MKVVYGNYYLLSLLKLGSQVWMSAIEGFVQKEVTQTFRAFLDFYYLVHQNVLDDDNLEEIQDALKRFYTAQVVFQELGV